MDLAVWLVGVVLGKVHLHWSGRIFEFLQLLDGDGGSLFSLLLLRVQFCFCRTPLCLNVFELVLEGADRFL